MHLLNQVHVGYTTPNFWVDVVKLIPEELFWSLLFRKEVSAGRDHSHTDNVPVDRNEPRPMKLLRVEDHSVVFRLFARNARATDGTGDLREKGDLLVIATDIFRTGDTLVGEKGCLARAIEHDLGFDVLALTVRPANRYAAHA